MGLDALTRAAAAAGYAMAPIDEVEYDTEPAAKVVHGDAVARGARTPKGAMVPVARDSSLTVLAPPLTAKVGLIGSSIATGQAVGQAVYGYIAGRGATTA